MSDAQPSETTVHAAAGGSLTGRVVLVTGASRGIGAAVAAAAAREGADVAVACKDCRAEADQVAAGVRALGRDADVFEADLADADQARSLVRRVEERFGRVDGLVNNAGVMPQTPFLEIDEAEWGLVLDTNLRSAFLCSQAVIPGMLERGRGSIVMMSSRLGQIGFAGVAHYSVSKAGLIALAKSISREFGARGVRANSIAPGVTVTDMGAQVMDGEVGRRRLAELPLGRFATPDDITGAATFLLSDASAVFLGQTLNPNSGGFMP